MYFLLATENPHKMEEFRRILEPLGFDVVPSFSVAPGACPEETGRTFSENARLKADALFRLTGLPTIADDSGLIVDALGGEPGIRSARYAGSPADPARNTEKLLRALEGVPEGKRTARFVCAVCCILSKDRRLETGGTAEGSIATAPRGKGGFGYDPVFLLGGRSFAEMTDGEKDAVSHRGRALRLLARELSGRREGET